MPACTISDRFAESIFVSALVFYILRPVDQLIMGGKENEYSNPALFKRDGGFVVDYID